MYVAINIMLVVKRSLRLAVVLATTFAPLACHHAPVQPPTLEGDGVAKSESREIQAFTSIELRGALGVELTTGPLDKLVLTGDENVLSAVSTTVEDGVLIVRETQNVSSKTPLSLAVHAPLVKKVGVHGVAKLHATGLSETSFTLTCQGTASAELSGAVDTLDVEMSGAGHVSAVDLVAKTARVKLSGTGSVDVNATDTLSATVSGVGSVRYKGSPKVDRNISGVGKIEPIK